MGASELRGHVAARGEARRAEATRALAGRALAGAWGRAYLAAWALTGAGAAGVAAGGPWVAGAVRQTLALSFAGAAPSATRAVAIFAHNLPIAAWPMLLPPIGAHRSRRARRVADLLVAVSLAGNALPVGAALGVYGARLLPYLPQLPIEWAGLACGPAWWLLARRRAAAARGTAAWLAVTAMLIAAAAVVETCLAGRP